MARETGFGLAPLKQEGMRYWGPPSTPIANMTEGPTTITLNLFVHVSDEQKKRLIAAMGDAANAILVEV